MKPMRSNANLLAGLRFPLGPAEPGGPDPVEGEGGEAEDEVEGEAGPVVAGRGEAQQQLPAQQRQAQQDVDIPEMCRRLLPDQTFCWL